VAILGCGTFILFCNRHPADLVAPDYYEQELGYQAHLDCVHNARQSPRPASVVYDPERQLIRIVLPLNAGPGTASGSIQLYRPSAADQDRFFKLDLDAEGVQTLDAATLAPGLWKVRASWTVESQGYFLDQSVVIHPRASARSSQGQSV
jgi:hypothetical protein